VNDRKELAFQDAVLAELQAIRQELAALRCKDAAANVSAEASAQCPTCRNVYTSPWPHTRDWYCVSCGWFDGERGAMPQGRRYSVEPHGNGHAIYQGRDAAHHGLNLGYLTECSTELPALIERALNGERGAGGTPDASAIRERQQPATPPLRHEWRLMGDFYVCPACEAEAATKPDERGE
jgi:hypothetical protein